MAKRSSEALSAGAVDRFAPANRRDLLGLGVLPEQIEQLEPILPLIHALLNAYTEVVPLKSVLDEFNTVGQTIRLAINQLTRLREPRKREHALSEVRVRMTVELPREHRHASIALFDNAIGILDLLSNALDRAKNNTPKRQRYSHAASIRPIQLINQALVRGWGAVHFPLRNADSDESLAPVLPAPDYPFAPKRGANSPFYRVVQICYTQVRPDVYNPDRAIRAFIDWDRAERERVRIAAEAITVVSGQSRPRKRGRKGVKKPDLPSTT